MTDELDRRPLQLRVSDCDVKTEECPCAGFTQKRLMIEQRNSDVTWKRLE